MAIPPGSLSPGDKGYNSFFLISFIILNKHGQSQFSLFVQQLVMYIKVAGLSCSILFLLDGKFLRSAVGDVIHIIMFYSRLTLYLYIILCTG